MRLFQTLRYPRRVYIKGTEAEMSKLSVGIFRKFEINPEDPCSDINGIFFVSPDMEEPYFPLGIINIVTSIASANGVIIESMDLLPVTYNEESSNLISNTMLSGITLRDYQMEGIRAGLYYKHGLIQVPTGGGKTEMMAAVAKYILDNTEGNVLVGVPSTNLLVQTDERLLMRGIDREFLSMLGGGNNFNPTRIVVSTVQSAYNRIKTEEKNFKEWGNSVTGLLLDECHHGSAMTWFSIIDGINAEYSLGFSAEPFYGDKDHVIKDMLLRGGMGSVVYRIPLQVLIQRGYLSQPYVFAVRSHCKGNIQRLTDWQLVNKTGLVNNESRNELISEVACYLISHKKNPLILVQQVQHGRDLALLISKGGYRVAVLTGGQNVAVFDGGTLIDEYCDPEETAKQQFQDGKIDAIVGTSVMDEGVDMPSLSAVILAGGGKSKLKLIQRIGRGLRPKEGDNTTFIIDFQDSFNRITHNQFLERKELFDNNQFPVYFVNDMKAFDYMVTQIQQSRGGII